MPLQLKNVNEYEYFVEQYFWKGGGKLTFLVVPAFV